MSVTITFLGAAGTVTGSKYLVEDGKSRVLVDAGLFQGESEWKEKNWQQPAFDASKINAVLLTHAHIDHTGMLPRFFRLGLACPVYATDATVKLSSILLRDSAHLQAEEAKYRQKPGRSSHQNPQPLYEPQDAENAISSMRSVQFNTVVQITENITARWVRAGHILGAGSIELTVGDKLISFSGDIGRYGVPILKDPEPVRCADLLLIESTYANREHEDKDPQIKLGEIISRTAQRRGVVLIPSFAVGRCQQLLFDIRALKADNKIPNIPVIVDSPMAADVTELYLASSAEYDEQSIQLLRSGKHPFSFAKLGFTQSRDDSIKLNSIDEPMVIISASGMLTGGRILHHLKNRVAAAKNTVLFVGYQPVGGKGWYMQQNHPTVRLFGEEIPMRAEVSSISGLSAHGDHSDLRHWLDNCVEISNKPKQIAVVHGEPDVAKAFAKELTDTVAPTRAATYLDTWTV